jgi:hypothetical protein
MNGTKTKLSLLPEQQLSCYRVWMKPKVLKKADRRHTLVGQFLLGAKSTQK